MKQLKQVQQNKCVEKIKDYKKKSFFNIQMLQQLNPYDVFIFCQSLFMFKSQCGVFPIAQVYISKNLVKIICNSINIPISEYLALPTRVLLLQLLETFCNVSSEDAFVQALLDFKPSTPYLPLINSTNERDIVNYLMIYIKEYLGYFDILCSINLRCYQPKIQQFIHVFIKTILMNQLPNIVSLHELASYKFKSFLEFGEIYFLLFEEKLPQHLISLQAEVLSCPKIPISITDNTSPYLNTTFSNSFGHSVSTSFSFSTPDDDEHTLIITEPTFPDQDSTISTDPSHEVLSTTSQNTCFPVVSESSPSSNSSSIAKATIFSIISYLYSNISTIVFTIPCDYAMFIADDALTCHNSLIFDWLYRVFQQYSCKLCEYITAFMLSPSLSLYSDCVGT